MIDRVEKQRIMGMLRETGLWAEADQFREEVRQRLRGEGKGKQEAVEGAWSAMSDKFVPLAEQVKPASETILPDGDESDEPPMKSWAKEYLDNFFRMESADREEMQ